MTRNMHYLQDAIGRWFCCNDSHVSLSSSQNVLSEKVYILFYILNSKNQKPSPNGCSSTAAKPFSTNGSGISSTSPNETLKIPLVKQNGSCSTKGNALLPLKNGKIASGPLIKPIHFKNSGTEKVKSNGKENLPSKMNPEVNESAIPSESNGHKTGKFAEPSKKDSDGTMSCGKIDDHSERILQDANGNGHLIRSQYLGEASNGNATCAQQYSEQSSGAVASKSPVSHHEESAKVKDVVNSSKDSVHLKRQHEEDKFKEVLAKSASSELRLSVWVDDVSNFMRSQKRRRIQNPGIPQDIDAMRKLLKSDSERIFRSKVPESLVESLIQRLRSYFESIYPPNP
jgi:ubiquitin carboxyl-terminal hydrolase 36/42